MFKSCLKLNALIITPNRSLIVPKQRPPGTFQANSSVLASNGFIEKCLANDFTLGALQHHNGWPNRLNKSRYA